MIMKNNHALLVFFVCIANTIQAVPQQEVLNQFKCLPYPQTSTTVWFWYGPELGLPRTDAQEAILHNTSCDEGRTPLELATAIGSANWLEFLLTSNKPPYNQLVALRKKILACLHDEEQLVITAEEKALLNQPLNQDGDSALLLASKYETKHGSLHSTTLINKLIEHGANQRFTDIYGNSYESMQVTPEDIEQYTKNIPHPDRSYSMWFWGGANEGIGFLPVEKALIYNLILKNGETALQVLARVRAYNWLIFLFSSNQKPFTSIAELHKKIGTAIETQTIPNLTELEKYQINQPDINGKTALTYAEEENCVDVINFIHKTVAHFTF